MRKRVLTRGAWEKKKKSGLPRRVDLVANLPEAKVPLDWVAQGTALVARSTSVHNHDDVLQGAHEIRMPAEVERGTHKLRARATVP
jgi:hypothetical protein